MFLIIGFLLKIGVKLGMQSHYTPTRVQKKRFKPRVLYALKNQSCLHKSLC